MLKFVHMIFEIGTLLRDRDTVFASRGKNSHGIFYTGIKSSVQSRFHCICIDYLRHESKKETEKWLQNGAQPTDTVRNILSHEGVLLKKHLLEGVKKGAFDEAKAEAKFQAWKDEKAKKAEAKKSAAKDAKATAAKARLEAEAKVNADRAEAIAKKKAEAAAAAAEAEAAANAEAPAEEAAAEAPAEA